MSIEFGKLEKVAQREQMSAAVAAYSGVIEHVVEGDTAKKRVARAKKLGLVEVNAEEAVGEPV